MVDFDKLIGELKTIENKCCYYDREQTNFFSENNIRKRSESLINELLKLEHDEKIPYTVFDIVCNGYNNFSAMSIVLDNQLYLRLQECGRYKYIFPVETPNSLHYHSLNVRIESDEHEVFIKYNETLNDYVIIVMDVDNHLVLNNSYLYDFKNYTNILSNNRDKLFSDNEFIRIKKEADVKKLLLEMFLRGTA